MFRFVFKASLSWGLGGGRSPRHGPGSGQAQSSASRACARVLVLPLPPGSPCSTQHPCKPHITATIPAHPHPPLHPCAGTWAALLAAAAMPLGAWVALRQPTRSTLASPRLTHSSMCSSFLVWSGLLLWQPTRCTPSNFTSCLLCRPACFSVWPHRSSAWPVPASKLPWPCLFRAGELTTLAEQEIVDCDQLDYGCDGEGSCRGVAGGLLGLGRAEGRGRLGGVNCDQERHF